MGILNWLLLAGVVVLAVHAYRLERGLRAQAVMIGRLIRDTNWVRKLNLPPEAR